MDASLEIERPVRVATFAAIPHYTHAPLYRRLAADPRLSFTAIFASTAGIRPYDLGYGQDVAWDVDLLGGYQCHFLRRAEVNPPAESVFALRDVDIVSTLRRGRYDVLWLFGYHTATHVLAALTQKMLRRPLLFREEQTLLHSRPRWKRAVKGAGLRFLFHGAGALYIGTENRKWFSHYGIPPERQFFTPYAVDNDALRAAAAELQPRKDALRERFGIAADAGPVVLSVARLIPKKQLSLLLEAFHRVRANHRCALLVVGSGPCESGLRAAVASGRVDDVVFAGFQPQSAIAEAYAAADVFALTSGWDETWGLAVNEAMNFSLPLVLSDKVGSAADLLRPGENGFLFPSTDVEALSAALERLVGSADIRERLGARSLAVVESWTYDRAARGVIEAVQHFHRDPRS